MMFLGRLNNATTSAHESFNKLAERVRPQLKKLTIEIEQKENFDDEC